MASGQEHEKSTKQWALPFAILIGLLFNAQSGLISGAAFLTGGLWLSPDLDTNSIAIKRWGILQGLWWPYQKVIPHRSIFSHGPFIGTVLRVIYLLSLSFLILSLLQPFGIDIAQSIKELIQQNPNNFLATLLGLEASAWLHLIKDGDPTPPEWRKLWHR